MGGKEIRLIYRRTRAEMPALPEDVASVEKEGIKIDFLTAPKRMISEKGGLSGIECVRMELGGPDGSGRPRPVPIKGSEFVIPVDTVIAAVGQTPELEFVRESGLPPSQSGILEISPGTGTTSIEGFFAGGDCAGGKAFVADAIASGKMGALAISCFLEGKDFKEEFQNHRIGTRPSFSIQHLIEPDRNSVDLKGVVLFDQINTLCFPHGARNKSPDSLDPEESITTFREVAKGLAAAPMADEVSRCFKCGTCTECDLCFLLCPDISIIKDEKERYRVKTDYCKGCSICASTCPRHVIEMGGGK
jgi:Pyruvate/2-oxoacid:ferredoxin oxidoreductase delta subunit